jgi:hypothetical protein
LGAIHGPQRLHQDGRGIVAGRLRRKFRSCRRAGLGDRRGGGWSPIAGAAAIAGYPSLTVPAGLAGGLPVGISLVGNRNQDGLLLQVAQGFERASNARVPPHLSI